MMSVLTSVTKKVATTFVTEREGRMALAA